MIRKGRVQVLLVFLLVVFVLGYYSVYTYVKADSKVVETDLRNLLKDSSNVKGSVIGMEVPLIEKSTLWRNYTMAIVNCITGKFYQPRPKPNPQHRGNLERVNVISPKESGTARKASFTDIFEHRVWGGGPNITGRVFGSGPGSTINHTQVIRRLLAAVIDQLKVILHVDRIRMLDIPCGDMAWMPVFLSSRSDVDYTGMDIVPAIIDSHRKYFKNNSSMRFVIQDVVKETLNTSYDLIFTRQMTQHLTTADTISVLRNFDQSGSKFLLATTVPKLKANPELNFKNIYRFRLQNFMISPYWLEKPVCFGPEKPGQPDVMGLWQLPFK